MTYSLKYTKIHLKPKNEIKQNNQLNYIYHETYALIRRLYLQTRRRPSTLISGILQPLLWLILFGALFQNAPVGLFTENTNYNSFLSPGIIIFTAFTGSINAGLPLMFDREFGFFNRLLSSPIQSRNSLIISHVIFVITITTIQTLFIILFNILLHKQIQYSLTMIFTTLIITSLITLSIGSISICLAFILPGHIELLAFILIINLPMLFSSTALAPLSFMPYWLQMIASINPLTYAIEITRNLLDKTIIEYKTFIIQNLWMSITIEQGIWILIIFNIINLIIVKNIIYYKFE
uniref:ABC transporter n=1 Tax=Hypnea brasiliensis TaxID=1866962 RepID=UPI0023F158B1|nr:ABC transporter [Hypnea brasiliensis]WCH55396.1 ABC transporter [Hypnea brasiliensis]WDY84813.1 ABC transporter [Hypnea brasiliensis]